MISEKLQRARDYEAEHKASADPERPAFHLTGAIGWINDPNGFSVYKNEYHLFYQYYPYSDHVGEMHWGHAKTKDFVKWEYLPTALAPDTSFDSHGCFSGSAVETPDGKHLLMYTGVVYQFKEDGSKDEWQHQCIAIGDGIDYEKVDLNPVIDSSLLPEGASTIDFRDPKIWRQEDDDMYYVVVGSRPADGSGSVLLYRSPDAINWEFLSVLDTSRREYGQMWECPDMFRLGDQDIIIVSPQEFEWDGLEFRTGFETMALIGYYRKVDHTFTRRSIQCLDYGFDFYAPQSTQTPDGRRVMVAWMENWNNIDKPRPETKLYGQLTLPRELHFINGRIVQTPVREFDGYHGEKVSYENVNVDGSVTLDQVNGELMDLTVTLRPAEDQSFESFRIKVADDGEHHFIIRYTPADSIVRIDRTNCSGGFDYKHIHEFRVRNQNGVCKFRILKDRGSVELFVNDGEQTATSHIYGPVGEGVTFEADGSAVIDVEKYALNL